VDVVENRAFIRGALPKLLAATRIEAQDFERVFVCSADAIGVAEGLALHLMLDGRDAGQHFAFDIRSEEHAIAPNYRRGVAASGHCGFPGDIAVMIPGEWEVLQRGDAVGGRAAPSGPIVRSGDRTGDGGECQER
jgi:hypothetical protein